VNTNFRNHLLIKKAFEFDSNKYWCNYHFFKRNETNFSFSQWIVYLLRATIFSNLEVKLLDKKQQFKKLFANEYDMARIAYLNYLQ